MNSPPPETIADVGQLDNLLSEPTPQAVQTLRSVEGDVILLGAGGKMGPTLARMVARAAEEAGSPRQVTAVSRFSDADVVHSLETAGINVIRGDLLDERFVAALPQVPNVIFMAGMKFGASSDTSATWAMNAYVPALVARHYRDSRIAAFSTGNVYTLVSPACGGSQETDGPAPIGEYAMSALGRERIFGYFCRRQQTPTAILRLNYACELRYGVLVDLCRKVQRSQPIDLSMGYVNVIWQGDANAMTICSLADCSVPEFTINIAGPEILRVRDVCERFGNLLGMIPHFSGTEAADALLNDGSKGRGRYGEPRVSAERLIEWIAVWVARGGESLGKPTHFETRDGQF
jgi:nucleoside-diphosphate-sugar epimerase